MGLLFHVSLHVKCASFEEKQYSIYSFIYSYFQQAKGYIPDMVLCSTATRTRQTLTGIHETLGDLSTHYDQDIYNGGEGALFQMIRSMDDKVDHLLIVGHNPVMHGVASRLAAEDESGAFMNRLAMGYAPGTLTVLEVGQDHWNDIQLHENDIIDLLDPIDYNAPDRPTRWT